MKKHFIKFALLLSLLLSVSCKNVFENEIPDSTDDANNQEQIASGDSDNTSSLNQKKYANIHGSMNLDGAYPDEIKNEVENISENENTTETDNTDSASDNRTALPSISSLYSKTYYVKAYYTVPAQGGGSPQTVTVNGTVNQSTREYSLGPLELGKNWTFEAGITGKYNAADNEVVLMKAEEPNVELSDTEPVKTFNFVLLPVSTGGDGEIALTLTVPSATIKKIKAVCTSANQEEWNSKVSDISVTSDTVNLNVSAIKSGTYDVTFYFMSDGTETDLAFPLYTSLQSICVFENMKTNTWTTGAAGGPIGSGAFTLTSALIQKYNLEHIYVGDPGTGKAALDTNEGGPFSPLATIGRAIQIIEKQNNTGNNYTIHITGSYNELGLSLNTTKASSITLVGINRDGTKSEITSTNHSAVLSIGTTKPVYIKNLVLRNGYSNEGGGLCIKNGANVTLEDGTEIRGSSSPKGGGVYVEASTLTMKTGALINGNQAMTSSEHATGGGVYLTSASTFNCKGGTIQNCYYGSSASTGKGAAIYVADTSTVKMTGGTIQNNPDTSKASPSVINGGAVYIEKPATFEISGNSSIPSDGTIGHNDVFLANDGSNLAKITVTGNLSQTGTVATITPAITALKTVILDGSSSLISANCSKFALTIENRGVSNIGKIRIDPIITDIYVTAAANGGSDTSGVGSSTSPFASLAGALKLITQQDEVHDYKIHISGTVSGAMEIPASSGTVDTPDYILIDSSTASSIELCGTSNTSDILQGPNPSVVGDDQTVLKVTTQIPVSIKKLKITGGYTTGQGGGIYIGSNSTVTLGEDALVNENVAYYGGGVYNAGTLYMTSNAVIGNAAQDRIAYDVTNLLTAKRGNWANYMTGFTGSGYGGGIYNTGKVYLGYTRYTSETDNTPDTTYSGGVYFNICSSATYSNDKSGYGGGIYSSGINSLIVMNGGTIKNNNTGSAGGGIYLADSAQLIMKNGSIESNMSRSIGGGLYIDASVSDGVVTGAATAKMSGGYIQNNVALNTNSGMPLNGLGVFVRGNFEISGSAYVKYENSLTDYTNYKNDIFLARDGAFIKVTGALTPPDAAKITVGENQVTNVAAVTPYQFANTSVWSRGQNVVKADFDISAYKDYFSMSKNKVLRREATITYGWYLKTKNENKELALDAPMFVAGALNKCSVCTAAGSSTGDGTVGLPFASIAGARGAMKEAVDYTIIIDGELTAVQSFSSFTGTKPTKITIEGFTGSSKDKISASSSAAGLSINVGDATVPVEIQKLSLSGNTNSSTANYGGGLCVSSGSKVTLVTDVIISGNKLTGTVGGANGATRGNGGGISNAGTLYIKGAKIYDNEANQYGGGIYNTGTLCLSGNVQIGAAGAQDDFSNTALSGGGIYNQGGTIYIGYVDESTVDTASTSSILINKNLATKGINSVIGGGGGIFNGKTVAGNVGGTIYMTGKSSIVRNKANDKGGGVFIDDKCNFYIYGGSSNYNSYIGNSNAGNEAESDGGGVYITGSTSKLCIGKDANGNVDSSNKSYIYYNTAKGNGGGIAIKGTSTADSNHPVMVEMAKGYIQNNVSDSGNSTPTYGGGIYAYKSTVVMSDGNLYYNEIKNGGTDSAGAGIYLTEKSIFRLGGGAYVSSNKRKPSGSENYVYEDIHMAAGAPIELSAHITNSPATVLTPPIYNETVVVMKLSENSTADLSVDFVKLKVSNDSDGNKWSITPEGKLVQGVAATPEKAQNIILNLATDGETVYIFGDAITRDQLDWAARTANHTFKLDLSKSTITALPNSVFWCGSKLTGIVLPSTLTSIGQYAFDSCTGLTSITIPASVNYIGIHAFRDTSLTQATFENKTGWKEGSTTINESQLTASGAANLLKNNHSSEFTRTDP